LGAALFAAVGIVSALYSRTKDAQGTRVDIGMLDCQAALMETALARYDVEGIVPNRTGDSHPSLAPFESFRTKDEKIVIAAGNDTLFMLMADALEIPGLALDPRFMTNDLRCKNRPEMVIEIEKALKQKPVTHWIDALNDVGVPCAPINTIDKLFDHPQLLSRDMIVQVEGPSKVPLRTAGNPIKMHGHEDIDVNTPLYAPGLGEHRERILAELLGNHGAYDLPADKQAATPNDTPKTKKTLSK